MRTWDQMREEVTRLAEEHFTFDPYVGDLDGGTIILDGEFNAAQLRVIADFLEQQEKET